VVVGVDVVVVVVVLGAANSSEMSSISSKLSGPVGTPHADRASAALSAQTAVRRMVMTRPF
jgi:hypothetical protein